MNQEVLTDLVSLCVFVCPECKAVVGTTWGTRKGSGRQQESGRSDSELGELPPASI